MIVKRNPKSNGVGTFCKTEYDDLQIFFFSFRIFHFIMCHTFWMGDSSVFLIGHSIVSPNFFLRQNHTIFTCEECGLALSCWKKQEGAYLKKKMLGWKHVLLQNLHLLSLSALLVPKQMCELPMPWALTINTHTIADAGSWTCGNKNPSGPFFGDKVNNLPKMWSHKTTAHFPTLNQPISWALTQRSRCHFWPLLCMVDFNLHLLMLQWTVLTYNDFLKWLWGIKGIQHWFSALLLTCRHFSSFSESFDDSMDGRWWNPWISCNCTWRNIFLNCFDFFSHAVVPKVVNFAPSLFVNDSAIQGRDFYT